MWASCFIARSSSTIWVPGATEGLDQLEKMAARIQQGQRAKGQKDFWGFVWQVRMAKNLTCNALEWQVSEGGGRMSKLMTRSA